MTDNAQAETLDGRRLRTERSKTAIAKAVLDLVLETGEPPTAEIIAARANVSRRSVFRLFEQMDDLYAEVIELTQAKVRARLEEASLITLPAAERAPAFVERLTALYEDIAPMRRLAETLRTRHAVIDARLRQDTRDLTHYIHLLFGKSPKGDAVTNGLVLALSWHAWDALRSEQGLSVRRARETLQQIVHSLI